MGAFTKLPDQAVLVWYDFICPFCYVGQQRTRILEDSGLEAAELPFQAHADVPIEGVAMGPRSGPMYDLLEREAAAAGLPLNWPSRLPNSRIALAAAEWVRRNDPAKFAALQQDLFRAHFVNGEDLGDPAVIDQHLIARRLDPGAFWTAVDEGSAEQAVVQAEELGRSLGVRGTPAWLIGGRLVSGLRPQAEFEELAGRQQQAVL
jgi:predicted DsbA family dithiol-disulfide isomerase